MEYGTEPSDEYDDEENDYIEDSEGPGKTSEETGRIKFSREADLQRYRASRHRRMPDYRSEDYNINDANLNNASPNNASFNNAGLEEPAHPTHPTHEDSPSYGSPSYGYASGDPASDEEAHGTEDKERRGLFEFSGDSSSLLAIPAIMLVTLIALLLLTFYAESIPAFMGALASSMLIVTLIIYGAATLLKA